MEIQVINSEHKTYTNLGRYFYCEMRSGKHHATVTVAPKHLQVSVHNASNHAWRGPGRRFETLEAVMTYYKTPAIRAMAQYAAEEWKRAGVAENSGDADEQARSVPANTETPDP
jgi:hypothetical protein